MPNQHEESSSTDMIEMTRTDSVTNPIHLRHPNVFQCLLIGTLVLLPIAILGGIILVQLFPRKVSRSTMNPPPKPTSIFQSSTFAPKVFTSINEAHLNQLFLDHINYLRHASKLGRLNLINWDDNLYENAKARLKTCDISLSNKSVSHSSTIELFKVWSWNVLEVWCAPWKWYEYGRKNNLPGECTYQHNNIQCREMVQLLSSYVQSVGCAAQVCPDHHVIAGCVFDERQFKYLLYHTNDTCEHCNREKCYEGLCATPEQCDKYKLVCSDVKKEKIPMRPYSSSNVNKDNIIPRVMKNIQITAQCSRS